MASKKRTAQQITSIDERLKCECTSLFEYKGSKAKNLFHVELDERRRWVCETCFAMSVYKYQCDCCHIHFNEIPFSLHNKTYCTKCACFSRSSKKLMEGRKKHKAGLDSGLKQHCLFTSQFPVEGRERANVKAILADLDGQTDIFVMRKSRWYVDYKVVRKLSFHDLLSLDRTPSLYQKIEQTIEMNELHFTLKSKKIQELLYSSVIEKFIPGIDRRLAAKYASVIRNQTSSTELENDNFETMDVNTFLKWFARSITLKD